jgi:hypothetical protein
MQRRVVPLATQEAQEPSRLAQLIVVMGMTMAGLAAFATSLGRLLLMD